jgi:hypothetical protein
VVLLCVVAAHRGAHRALDVVAARMVETLVDRSFKPGSVGACRVGLRRPREALWRRRRAAPWGFDFSSLD